MILNKPEFNKAFLIITYWKRDENMFTVFGVIR